MDWSKAKNILIVALLITNLILGLAIYSGRDTYGGYDAAEVRNNTVLLLKEHGIFVEEEIIPERVERLPIMSVRYRTVSDEKVAETIAAYRLHLADGTSDEEYRRASEELLMAVGIPKTVFAYEETVAEGETVTVRFGTAYEEYSLDNAKLQVVFEHGRPKEIPGNWVEPVSMGQNRKHVMSSTAVLANFMNLIERQTIETEEPSAERERITINEMRLVYCLEGYTNNGGVSEDTAVPYWCIRYNDEKSAYIAAYEE